MISIKEVAAYTPIPRTVEFVEQLHSDEFELLPSAMARLNETDAASLREPILMSVAACTDAIGRLKSAIADGEPDNRQTEAALLSYQHLRLAVQHWATADAGNRWPQAAEN
jgi:hypothetical protein